MNSAGTEEKNGKKETILNNIRENEKKGLILPIYAAPGALIYENLRDSRNPVQIWAVEKTGFSYVYGIKQTHRSGIFDFWFLKYKKPLLGKCRVIEKDKLYRHVSSQGNKLKWMNIGDSHGWPEFTFFEERIGRTGAEKAKETFYELRRTGRLPMAD